MLLLFLIQLAAGPALEVVVYYTVCGTAQGLMVTQVTEAPHSARRAKHSSNEDLPICSPWTFRENHSPNIIYTVNRRNQPTAMDLYFLDWVRTRYKSEPETHTKSAHTGLGPCGRQL